MILSRLEVEMILSLQEAGATMYKQVMEIMRLLQEVVMILSKLEVEMIV